MKKHYLLKLCVFASFLMSIVTTSAQNPTSPTKDFNIFVENDLTLKTNESEGPVAVGGDLTIAGTYQAAIQNGGTFLVNGVKIGLLVGGKVNYNSGTLQVNQNTYVKIGNSTGSTVWYYDQNNAATNIRVTPGPYDPNSKILLQTNATNLGVSSGNNPVFQSGLIDFAGAFQTMRTEALSLAACQHNAQITNANGNPIPNTNLPNQIKINMQNGVNIFNVSGADINNVQVLTYTNTPSQDKVLLINVDAPGTFTWNVWNQAGISFQGAQYVIYNFYNTTTLNIAGSPTVEGTIFAPFADVNKIINQSNIQGQVIGKSFNHQGGQVHYAAFKGSVSGCAPVVSVPVADFDIDDSSQCLAGNTFQFTNTSTDATSYHWDFGDGTSSTDTNPTKTYTTAGTHTVTLTATNVQGTDSHSISVTVFGIVEPAVSESSNAANGVVTKNFTLTNANQFSAYSWSLDGLGSNLYPNTNVVAFDFTQAGYYEVELHYTNLNGCSGVTVLPIVISSEEIGTGNDGGLESESLGDALSKRYVQRKISSTPTVFDKSKAPLFTKPQHLNYRQGTQTLLQMFPTQLVAGSIANVSSPTDILDYTVAQEVLSVDFSVAGKTKAVVLGVRTVDRVYNHTKASCDRLKGAEILNVKSVSVNGYNFLMQALKQRSGYTEYAISFAVGKNHNDQWYSLQTNWFVNEYTPFNNVYNFQVWSTTPEYTTKLVKDILNNLNGFVPVEQITELKMPQTYVSKVSREGLDLVLKLRSSKENQSIEFEVEEVYSETHGYSMRYNPVMSELEQTIRIRINDGYEYDGLVKVNGQVQDAFYHADGNWGLDFDSRYTTIQQYQVYNNFEREFEEDEKLVHRNVKLKVHSEYDYLTLYKSLLPGNLPDNYTDYEFLSFTAKGNGLLDIGLVKSSIEKWSDQYKATINVRSDENTYYIPLSYFKSAGTRNAMVADDLTMLTFTFLPVEAGTNDLDLVIEDVKFTHRAPQGYEELLNTMRNEYVAYPNPTNGEVNCILYSDTLHDATVTLRDITGKLVYSTPIKLTEGRNELKFDFSSFAKGIMFMNITGKMDFGTTKVIIK